MLNNYFTLRAIARELHESLQGQTIAESFTQEKDTLAIGFVGLRDTLALSCKPNLALLYLHPAYARARANSADICRGCWGDKVQAVSIHPSDRIVSLALDGGNTLYALLFGPKANVLLVDAAGIVLDSFKNAHRLVGTHFTLPLPLPPFDRSALDRALQHSPDQTVEAVLKRLLPLFGPLLIAEVLYRSGIPALRSASQVTSDKAGELTAVIATLSAELERPSPILYTNELTPPAAGGAVTTRRFSIITLHHLGDMPLERHDNVQHAVRLLLASRDRALRVDQAKKRLLDPLQRLADKTSRTLRAMAHELAEHDRAAQWERYGSFLMARLPELRKGMSVAHLADGAETITISLDPSLSPIENAQRYFEKAKRAKLAQRKARTYLQREESTLAHAQRVIAALRPIDTMEGMKRYMNDHETDLNDLGVGKKSRERATIPFRIFTVDGGFEVFAGKSEANNDLLTMKHAKPRDLWFHARGASGSHVVLRMGSSHGQPSKKAKEQAAAIAAYYSKMRTAKLVPVACTERKYVRKPKGAPPGTVVLEREQVIFARPALPPQNKA